MGGPHHPPTQQHCPHRCPLPVMRTADKATATSQPHSPPPPDYSLCMRATPTPHCPPPRPPPADCPPTPLLPRHPPPSPAPAAGGFFFTFSFLSYPSYIPCWYLPLLPVVHQVPDSHFLSLPLQPSSVSLALWPMRLLLVSLCPQLSHVFVCVALPLSVHVALSSTQQSLDSPSPCWSFGFDDVPHGVPTAPPAASLRRFIRLHDDSPWPLPWPSIADSLWPPCGLCEGLPPDSTPDSLPTCGLPADPWPTCGDLSNPGSFSIHI